jgi:membrane fusion protein, multidrug efflux system
MTRIRPKQWSRADGPPPVVLVCLALTVAMLSASCSKPNPSADKARKSRAVPVTVAPVIQKDVPLELDTFGRAQSKASVTIKAQVAQVIQAVHFQEGQKIARGDLLFTLDSRPYEVALAHARAALARDKVLSDDAQLEVRRDAELLAKKILAQEDYDKAKSAANALAETLKADQAAIDAAQIDVDNCRIASPIEGRAGKVLVHAGNLVTAKDIPLVMINQIKPIDVFFSLPQAQLDRVRAYQSKADLAVEATLPGEPERPEKGSLAFIDNRIDPSNGTIEIGATFPNPDERLWPGRYVLVHLMLTVQRNAIVAPLRAIETGSSGQYVFVVKQGQTAELRTVKMARTVGDDAVIEAGLQAGEQVVTDGQLQLEDGTKVEIGFGAAAPSGAGAAR